MIPPTRTVWCARCGQRFFEWAYSRCPECGCDTVTFYPQAGKRSYPVLRWLVDNIARGMMGIGDTRTDAPGPSTRYTYTEKKHWQKETSQLSTK